MDDRPSQQPPPSPDPRGEVRREDAAERRLDALDQEARRIDVERAKLLVHISRARHHFLLGCASLAEYGAQRGYRACITRDLLGVGHLLEGRPEFEEDLLTGRISFRAAAALQEVLQLPGVTPSQWIDAVRRCPSRDFCAHVEEAKSAVAFGAPPIRLSLLLTPRGHLVFRDAKAAVEQQRQRILSDGEAVQALAEHFMEGREPPRRGSGPSPGPQTPVQPGGSPPPGPLGSGAPGDPLSLGVLRGGDTAIGLAIEAEPDSPEQAVEGAPPADRRGGGQQAPRGLSPRRPPGRRGRYIPVAVRRAVRLRWGGRCAVPHCTHRGILHFAHAWVAHRDGGPAEFWNLLLLCPVHNQMMERGLLRVGGTPEQPLFFDHEGRPYRLRPSAGEGDARGPPGLGP